MNYLISLFNRKTNKRFYISLEYLLVSDAFAAAPFSSEHDAVLFLANFRSARPAFNSFSSYIVTLSKAS